MLNVNKIFPWLSIRNKLLIAFGGLSILPVLFIGMYGLFSNIQTMRHAALEDLTSDVQTTREKTANFFSDVSSDLRVIQNSPSVASMENFLSSETPIPQYTCDQVGKELLSLVKIKGVYYQFRVLDENGDERLRVECTNPNDQIKTFRIVPRRELQQTPTSYYFLFIDSTHTNRITITPAEVRFDNNQQIPVISFAIPLRHKNSIAGMVIANVFEKDFIRVIENKQNFSFHPKVMLVTGDGHYLYHSERKKNWNHLLATREEDKFQRDYPASVTQTVLSGGTGTMEEGTDEIISYAPLFPAEKNNGRFESISKFTVPVYEVESVPESEITLQAHSFATVFVGFTVLFLFTAIGLGLVATRQFTRPIAQLESGAEIITRGNYRHRLTVRTNDEIGKLADQFNVMATSLEEHEEEILRHRNKLEEMVEEKTHQLYEEKTKLQALLDNVPSAFILLDNQYRIQTASAAFEGLTSVPLQAVKGKDCSTLFGSDGECKECLCRKAVERGTAQNRIEHLVEKDHGERFIERIAIPMRENNKTNSILQIVTDVTKRKRFEQELVYTEKLTAAGEMSSFVAHEFRNSLTSIKMIMQLLRESKRITRTEKKSLNVALDSMSHMERIVIELLDFAKPKLMQKTSADINTIVSECLEFIKSHVKGKRITIEKKLESPLGNLLLDISQVKESIINVLLNSIQSMEKTHTISTRGTISVVTRREHLKQTMRDLAFGRSDPDMESGQGQSEIILTKGSPCIVIEITDSGPGMGKEQLARIFDPFFTTKVNGTGLGLPMVKRTINAHGGIVLIESKPGKGTTVHIYLPVQNEIYSA